jgi:hypothetical protein
MKRHDLISRGGKAVKIIRKENSYDGKSRMVRLMEQLRKGGGVRPMTLP